MNEKRFFENSGPYTLKKLSDHISGKLDSLKNSEVVIEDIASLKNAKSNETNKCKDTKKQKHNQCLTVSIAMIVMATLRCATSRSASLRNAA